MKYAYKSSRAVAVATLMCRTHRSHTTQSQSQTLTGAIRVRHSDTLSLSELIFGRLSAMLARLTGVADQRARYTASADHTRGGNTHIANTSQHVCLHAHVADTHAYAQQPPCACPTPSQTKTQTQSQSAPTCVKAVCIADLQRRAPVLQPQVHLHRNTVYDTSTATDHTDGMQAASVHVAMTNACNSNTSKMQEAQPER